MGAAQKQPRGEMGAEQQSWQITKVLAAAQAQDSKNNPGAAHDQLEMLR